VKLVESGFFGQIIDVHAGFYHSSDLDTNKPINWKRKVAMNGEYGCMGDLGLHVLHLPLRFGWTPWRVQSLLSNIVKERPSGDGSLEPCETWDNATLACLTADKIPMLLETKRIAPGETNTWFIKINGTQGSAEFSTKRPKTLRTMKYTSGSAQTWQEEDLGYSSAYPGITGHIFEFGFPDSILQMWAAYCDELVNGENMIGSFRCATPEEALMSHRVFTAALSSWESFIG
jgi:predicted dehydrogenase